MSEQGNVSHPVQADGATSGRPVIQVALHKVPLLSGLDPKVLAEVAAALHIRTVTRGQYVLHKGTMGDCLLFLLSGRLQAIDVTEEGREVGLSIITPGEYFGELSIIDDLPRSASVMASESSLVALLPKAQAQALIYNNPLVAERLLKRMAASIRRAADYRTILGIPNAFQRVFALIHRFAEKGHGDMITIDRMPTQQEIAIMANTSRETVSRALQLLIQKGIVEKDTRRLIIRQPEKLRKAANGDQALAV